RSMLPSWVWVLSSIPEQSARRRGVKRALRRLRAVEVRGARTRRLCARGAARAEGTTALKAEAELKLSPAEQLEQQQARQAPAAAAEKRAEAKAKGYEGEACGECGNFTLVRNGTCLKCDTCGGTTGRS